ncbi:MAG: transcriptional regulator [Fimbriimonadaceae bacterium]|nr:transcriptional regulator [Fimbriimonadaceae bacterium]
MAERDMSSSRTRKHAAKTSPREKALSARRLAMGLLLFSRGRMTGDELAGKLGVALRTVYRDIVDMEGNGLPVTAVPGPSGGFEFDYIAAGVKGIRTEQGLLDWYCEYGLLPSEQTTFEMVLKMASTVLEASDQDALKKIKDRILFDPEEWYSRERPKEELGVILRAVLGDSRLVLHYVERTGEEVIADEFDPFGLVWKGGYWYVFGFSHNARRNRRIRVQRISEVRETGELFERPKEFDLDASWRAELGSFGKGTTRVVLRIEKSVIAEFENFNWKEENRIEKFADYWIVEMLVDRYDWLIPLVLSYFGEVIVSEPEELRAKIIKAAGAVISAHGKVADMAHESLKISDDTRARASGHRMRNIRN